LSADSTGIKNIPADPVENHLTNTEFPPLPDILTKGRQLRLEEGLA